MFCILYILAFIVGHKVKIVFMGIEKRYQINCIGIDSLKCTDSFAYRELAFLEMHQVVVFIRMGTERFILMLIYMRHLTGGDLRK